MHCENKRKKLKKGRVHIHSHEIHTTPLFRWCISNAEAQTTIKPTYLCQPFFYWNYYAQWIVKKVFFLIKERESRQKEIKWKYRGLNSSSRIPYHNNNNINSYKFKVLFFIGWINSKEMIFTQRFNFLPGSDERKWPTATKQIWKWFFAFVGNPINLDGREGGTRTRRHETKKKIFKEKRNAPVRDCRNICDRTRRKCRQRCVWPTGGRNFPAELMSDKWMLSMRRVSFCVESYAGRNWPSDVFCRNFCASFYCQPKPQMDNDE